MESVDKRIVDKEAQVDNDESETIKFGDTDESREEFFQEITEEELN